MRKGGGKQKGASFEREICVKLSLWATGGRMEDAYWRSAMSGGRSTVAAKKGKRLSNQAGDISCVHPEGATLASLFMMECKHYASLDFHGLITGSGKLIEFWIIAKQEATRVGKMPMLIAKQNRMPTVICLDLAGMRKLRVVNEVPLVICNPFNLYIIAADTFFSTIRPPKEAHYEAVGNLGSSSN